MSPPTVVRYEPGKGASYSQPLRPSRPRGAWPAIQRFLAECAEVQGPGEVTLRAYRATEWDDASVAEACIARVQERFGPASIVAEGGRMFPSGEPVKGGYYEWRGPAERFAEFRDFLLAGDPWPKTVLGPVELSFGYSFFWRDPDGLGPIEEQLAGHATTDGRLRSRLGISLERSSSVQPELWFPFSPEDPRLHELVHLMMGALPFKLSPKHFRAAVPIKDGSRYVFRRFDASSLLAA